MQTVIGIALFGALGCLARYYLSGWVFDRFGQALPWGTLAVNAIGAFLIGFVMELALRSSLVPHTLRISLTIGFLGGFTTFSTFSYETFKLLENNEFIAAFSYVAASVLICLAFTWIGIFTVRQI